MKTAVWKGWTIVDNSTTVGTNDPTRVIEWNLTRGEVTHKVSEIFGDWAVGEVFVSSQKSKVNYRLLVLGMPKIAEIEEALDNKAPASADPLVRN